MESVGCDNVAQRKRRALRAVFTPDRRTVARCLFAAALLLTACGRADKPQVGGPFHLVDQYGQPRTERLLKGKWTAVFFGYTYCPDVCPATLQMLSDAEDRLGPKAQNLQVVFVTIDPQRDTPTQLRDYLSSSAFPKGTIGLTGSPAEIAQAAKAYHAFYKQEGTGQDYSMEHTSAVYLMNPRGRFNRVLAYGLTPDDTARLISEAMREG